MTPLDEIMRNAVMHRLSLLDQTAEHGGEDVVLPLARAEIHRLAEGWRQLLTVHQPDDAGRCKACPAGLRRRRWPCQVWQMAHQHLIGDGESHRQRRNPLSDRLGRLVRLTLTMSPEPPPDVPDEHVNEVTIELTPVTLTPVGGHLETDSSRIHRASVIERASALTRWRRVPRP